MRVAQEAGEVGDVNKREHIFSVVVRGVLVWWGGGVLFFGFRGLL